MKIWRESKKTPSSLCQKKSENKIKILGLLKTLILPQLNNNETSQIHQSLKKRIRKSFGRKRELFKQEKLAIKNSSQSLNSSNPVSSAKSDRLYLKDRIEILNLRIESLQDPIDIKSFYRDIAIYLLQKGFHNLDEQYHSQPMSSSIYPNSKKKGDVNYDIYQSNHPSKNNPQLFFLKTDSEQSNILNEYYSSRLLYLFCRSRPLTTSPKVFLTEKKGETHLLSEFIVSNSESAAKFADMPMFPYLAAIMICRKERDVNPANYLNRTSTAIYGYFSLNNDLEIPIAVRIDHGSEPQNGNKNRNPITNHNPTKQSVETLFALTSIFENNLGWDYDDISWNSYNIIGTNLGNKKISFIDSILRDKNSLMVIKDPINYLLFMRGIVDFINLPEELIDICYLQEKRSISDSLKNDLMQTKEQVQECFKLEIERFNRLIKEKPFADITPEYLNEIDFSQIIEYYHLACKQFGAQDIIGYNKKVSSSSLSPSPKIEDGELKKDDSHQKTTQKLSSSKSSSDLSKNSSENSNSETLSQKAQKSFVERIRSDKTRGKSLGKNYEI